MQGTDNRIRHRMAEVDISVNALADATAIPRMTLTRRLADPSGLTFGELERIADALDVSALYLLTGDEAA